MQKETTQIALRAIALPVRQNIGKTVMTWVRCKLSFIIMKSTLLCLRDSQMLILSMLITSVLRVTIVGSEILFFEFWRPVSLLSFLFLLCSCLPLALFCSLLFCVFFICCSYLFFTSWSNLILATFSPHSCSLVCHTVLSLICYIDFSILLLYLF